MSEQRLIDIETKILQQDLIIDDLNQVIYAQQEKLDLLENKLTGLLKRFRDQGSGDIEVGPSDDKPPHY